MEASGIMMAAASGADMAFVYGIAVGGVIGVVSALLGKIFGRGGKLVESLDVIKQRMNEMEELMKADVGALEKTADALKEVEEKIERIETEVDDVRDEMDRIATVKGAVLKREEVQKLKLSREIGKMRLKKIAKKEKES